ncbi:hypothetical protein APHAL10511_006631 [Amanita phalloides]|nr:hypothetical protein APHAL10511_006631 [Amanita phalloides]
MDNKAPLSESLPGKAVLEDYLFYAALQRQQEEEDPLARSNSLQGSEPASANEKKTWISHIVGSAEKTVIQPHVQLPPMTENELERANASRALRLASWASVFYLITTDILGPFNAPYAISQVGWVPGVVLYFVMGIAATYSGLVLWKLFIKLDSLRYPLKTYGDIAERIYGKTAKHICTLLQSLQLIVNVGTICLGNGQALAQISNNRLCFAVCIVIFPIIGFIIGQIRTLKSYTFLANSAVWINLTIIFISMGFVAHSPPNYAAAKQALGVNQGPVLTEKFVTLPLYNRINGIMNMVFAYGGAMIFPEIMAEMRRPMDFWKGLVRFKFYLDMGSRTLIMHGPFLQALAQMVIFVAYLLYGCFIYAFQGQFTLPLAYQGVSKYSWQTVGNVLSLVTGIIAGGLYGNIGIKVVYINIVEGWFKAPHVMTHRGRIIWTVLVFVYWSIAFVIGSAIPQIQTITGLIAAIAIMQFSYTFPPLLLLGYNVITDAMSEDGPHVPGSGGSGRIDTWRNFSRWKRGLFGGSLYSFLFKLFNLVLGLAGLATACLGMWGAGEAIKATFALGGAATSFGCTAPV